MRASTLFAFVLASLSCTELAAQTVWPQGFAGTNGGSSHATPFSIAGGPAPARTRSVLAISAASLPFSAGHVIQGIAFRRDAVHGAGYAGYSAAVQVRIRTVPDALTLTAAAHKVFQATHQVFNGTVGVPSASPPPGQSTAPFALSIPFATGWTYPGGDLAIELTVSGPPGSIWRCDGVDLPWSDGGSAVGLGAGCITSGGDLPPMYVEDTRTVVPGGSAEFAVDRIMLPPAGAAVFFLMGAPASGVGLGVLGMDPSCLAYVNPIAIPLGFYGNRMVHHARAGFGVSVPNSPGLAGARLSGQALIVDLGLSSSFPFCVSQAVEIEVGNAPPPASSFVGRTQWIHGSRPAGSVQGLRPGRPNRVPVIEFF